MVGLYQRTDLAICRAGATSVAELCAAGIGALYVPLPWAAEDHQTANARAVARVGGAAVLPQATTTAVGLAGILARLLMNRGEVARLGEQATRLAKPHAAADVVHLCRTNCRCSHAKQVRHYQSISGLPCAFDGYRWFRVCMPWCHY